MVDKLKSSSPLLDSTPALKSSYAMLHMHCMQIRVCFRGPEPCGSQLWLFPTLALGSTACGGVHLTYQ